MTLDEIESLKRDKERLDWLLAALMEPGQVLNELGWTDGRAAIDEAIKNSKTLGV